MPDPFLTAAHAAQIARQQGIAEQHRLAVLPSGAIDETIMRTQNNISTGAITSQRLQLGGVVLLPARQAVTSISFQAGGTPLSAGVNQWFCLVRVSDRAVLAKTVDDTSTAWSANAVKTLALSATYTPTQATLAYVGIMVNATTPTLYGFSGSTANLGLAPIISGFADTGLTTPASLGATAAAITASSLLIWAYVS
jgi:hypothetical protein